MTTIFLVAVCSMGIGVGLSFLMLGGIIQAERRRGEVYPAIRNEQPPIPICHPDRHNALTGAYQDDERAADLHEALALAERLTAELNAEIDELERDAHEYRQEIRRLRDELAELRFPVAPVATTASRYNVIDKFEWIEVSE